MRRCIFCGREVDIVLWVVQDMSDYPVPACSACADERGLIAFPPPARAEELPDAVSCRCCGRALPSQDSWPPVVWVQDGSGVMAVCNACRVEYALEAVSTSVPRDQGRPPHIAEAESASPD